MEQSKGGLLAKELRATVKRLAPVMGFTLKVVENAGSSLGAIFSNKNPWAGQRCGRDSCNPCGQGKEKVEDCKKSYTNLYAKSATQGSRSKGHL